MTKTSRFNYIKRGLVGVCAATMLTGLCAGTAFGATVTPGVNNGAIGADNTASTVVSAQVDGQLSATVPTSLTVAVKSDDGSLVFPEDKKLYIENTSSAYAVHVVSIEATTGTLLNAESAYPSSSAANAAWLKIGTTAADQDLSTKLTVADSNWDVPSSGKLNLKFAGAVKNVSSFDSFTLTTLTWTIGGGLYPAV
ncbi:hypothetical protein [Gordonibacter pamelaeae]|uniref:hypothetical protein n=1 Tax=Gordonibacter pamelaeae TaxID=471189 RepID=UPI00242CCAA8|nr:hypothetical protein [Gordonibacter pamelaeae]